MLEDPYYNLDEFYRQLEKPPEDIQQIHCFPVPNSDGDIVSYADWLNKP